MRFTEDSRKKAVIEKKVPRSVLRLLGRSFKTDLAVEAMCFWPMCLRSVELVSEIHIQGYCR